MNKYDNLIKMRRVSHIHFVGIGGIGMSGIAEVLHNEGYKISGSDVGESATIGRLKAKGIHINLTHVADNIKEADVVVQSSAIANDNPEILAAKQGLIPVIPRAMMLAELMRYRFGIAISGTHGKTTTTSLVAHILAEAGLEPSYVIGGKLNSTGQTACLGKSKYMVVEADESDASFLHLDPTITIVTNIDADHMATYDSSIQTLRQTFIQFLHRLPFYGLAIVCLDDLGNREILSEIKRPLVTYGFDEQADVRACHWQQQGLMSIFEVHRQNHQPLKVRFNLPGKHNVRNALAAIVLAMELGVDDQQIVNGLASFQGVGRRCELHGDVNFKSGQALLIDDYGHHPREIESTIEAIRQVWPKKRLVLAFQPHRYSRTRDLFDDFVKSLAKVDCLVLLPVYAAGENELPAYNHQALLKALDEYAPKLEKMSCELNQLPNLLDTIVQPDDLVLTQGAGSIGRIAQQLGATKEKLQA